MFDQKACQTPIDDHIARIVDRLSSGQWRLIVEHPNPAEGTSVYSPEVSQEVGRRLRALASLPPVRRRGGAGVRAAGEMRLSS